MKNVLLSVIRYHLPLSPYLFSACSSFFVSTLCIWNKNWFNIHVSKSELLFLSIYTNWAVHTSKLYSLIPHLKQHKPFPLQGMLWPSQLPVIVCYKHISTGHLSSISILPFKISTEIPFGKNISDFDQKIVLWMLEMELEPRVAWMTVFSS